MVESQHPRGNAHPGGSLEDDPYTDAILEAHAAATAAGEPGYPDPLAGLFVFTAASLLASGSCCGSGCRHCPYP